MLAADFAGRAAVGKVPVDKRCRVVSAISDLATWEDGHHCLCGIRRREYFDYNNYVCGG